MNILIIGFSSYIGNKLKYWIKNKNTNWNINIISVRNNIPYLGNYDAVVHCAAYVHKNEKAVDFDKFYKVNTELTMNIAKKAKKEGVKHFIFLSTMAVYGEIGKIGKPLVINKNTTPNPSTYYGKSKLMAENMLKTLNDYVFTISILRPPIVYGPGCPGNFSRLKNMAKWAFIFPLVDNRRSMIYVDNICHIIYLIIKNRQEGIFYPQNRRYVNTSFMVSRIREANGKKTYLSHFLGNIATKFNISFMKKIFGNLVYDKELSGHFNNEYMLKE